MEEERVQGERGKSLALLAVEAECGSYESLGRTSTRRRHHHTVSGRAWEKQVGGSQSLRQHGKVDVVMRNVLGFAYHYVSTSSIYFENAIRYTVPMSAAEGLMAGIWCCIGP
jgi:hypothetical protein